MNFDLTDEQQALRRSVRAFAEKEIRPNVREWDEAQELPREVVRALGELGVLGALLPEDVGGAAMGYVEFALIMEELARVDPSVALVVAAQSSLCASHIDHNGSPAQRKKYLPKLASGEWIGCWSLTEPSSGSDAAAAKAKAVEDGDCWVLNGAKSFVTNAPKADVFVVMAVTDPSSRRRRISAFIIEKGTPGLEVARKEDKLGMRASETAQLHLTDCRIPKANLIGREGEGFLQTMKNLAHGRVSIAGLAVGIAQGAFEQAVAYAKQRKQFGKPIAEFQAIQDKLADMATQIEAARLLTLRAGWLCDEGRPNAEFSAMAKLYASEAAVRIADQALQVHGGYGFIKDYPIEKFYRDVKLTTIGEGTSEIQRMVIARQILKS